MHYFSGWLVRRSIIFALCCSDAFWCILICLKNLWLGKDFAVPSVVLDFDEDEGQTQVGFAHVVCR